MARTHIALSIAWLLGPQASADEAAKELATISVKENRSAAEKIQTPSSTESITRQALLDSVNAVNTEDALKYLPNILVRKRFNGDTDAPMSSRTTGINASARTLIYADGTLLSALLNNNNGNGSPRWFMVAPEEIARIDVMYGPFSAAYPGNSYGAVTEITTRMPQRLEGSVKINQAWQDFSQYGTQHTYRTDQLAASVGQHVGNISFWVSAQHLDGYSQPVTYGTRPQSATPGGATAVSGAYADRDRTGAAIQVLGPGNLTHTVQDNAKIKLGVDITPTLQALYTFGIWQNHADIRTDTYLRTANGNPYFGATAGTANIGGFSYAASTLAAQFAPGKRDMEHHMHSFTLRDDNKGKFAWEAAFSHYEYIRHEERSGLTGAQGSGGGATTYSTYTTVLAGGPGRILDMKGTGWTTADLKGIWRPNADHTVSIGGHFDSYKLNSPTWNTNDWSGQGSNGTVFSDARGKTQTTALWAQDVWRIDPRWVATLGARAEKWKAFDGFNATRNTGAAGWPITNITQPSQSHEAFSPKASLSWAATNDWQVTGSLGRAVRFPTVGELYSTIQVGSTFQSPNPTLKPEDVRSGELAFERALVKGKLRISLFQENVRNAIISQTAIYPGIAAPTSYTQNVDETRQRGIELVAQQQDVLIKGLDLSGNLTYVNARILANSSYVSPTATPWFSSVGKHTPYVPDWRATLVANYRFDAHWTGTLATRYQGRMYATVDNTDINGHTYQGFERFFVADARLRYQFDKQLSAAIGVDNLNNRKYFLFHPFPQRTLFAEARFDF